MCGIAGSWSPHGVSTEALRVAVEQLRHRGPDDQGFFSNGQVALASCRLSIIDLPTGKQPVSNEDGTLWLVFNGEIYNYPELRRQLVDHGHQFRTQSDTEVIVHLYEEYGPDCVKRLRGMFAFALWDAKEERLFLARDPLGQKPLYYTQDNGGFAFASEIKALLRREGASPRMNLAALHHAISLRFVPGTDTMFSGINKLPAGHTLVLHQGRVSLHQYWDARYEPKMAGSERQIASRLRGVLLETVACHMRSDVPIGAFLSGGTDSTMVAAMMATMSPTPIKAFTVGVREEGFNEMPGARMVARRYGMEHHELIVEPGMVAVLPSVLWHMEEPADPFAFGVFLVSEMASRYVKVLLGGDGGDEMFAGYDRYFGNSLVDLYCLTPKPLRRHVIEPLIRLLPDDFSYNNYVQRLRWLAAISESSAGERYAQSACFLRFGQAHKQALYTDALWGELGGLDSAGQLLRYFNAENATHPLDRMLYTDVKTRLAEQVLMVVDRMNMAHSVEGRSPYSDLRVAEFAAVIPAALKLRGTRLKHIYREVAREFLPKPLLNRRKQGFGFPVAYWMRGELRGLVSGLLLDSNLVAEGHFRQEAIRAMLDEHLSGRVDHNYRLWLLLSLDLWHRMFIGGQSQEELSGLLRRYLPGKHGDDRGRTAGRHLATGASTRGKE